MTRGRIALLMLAALSLTTCGGAPGGAPSEGAGPFTLAAGPFGTLTRLRNLVAAEFGQAAERTALSSDGALVAVGDAAGHVSLFEAATGIRRFVATLPVPGNRHVGTPSEGFANGLGQRVLGLAFLPGNVELIAINGYGTLVRIAVLDGALSGATEFPGAVVCLGLHPAGDRLAIGTDRGAIEEYVFPALTLVRTYRPADDAHVVHLARYAPGGDSLLTALADYDPADDGEVVLGGGPPNGGLTRWDTATGARLIRYAGPPGSATAFDTVGTGNTVAGVDHGVGHLYDAAGTEIAMGFELWAGTGEITSGGQAHAAFCSARAVGVLRLADRRVVAYSKDPLHTNPLTPRSFSSMPTMNRFVVGHQDGSAAVMEFAANAIPSAAAIVPKAQALGTANGATLLVTAELTGHATSVVELAVSPSGRFLASRDRDGHVMAWDLAGRPAAFLRGADTETRMVAAVPVGLGVCPPSAARITFGPGEQTLLARNDLGALLRIALPGATIQATVQVMNGAQPVAVRSAIDISAAEMLVSSEAGGLFVCDMNGAVQQTLVADQVTAATDPLPIPFTTLLPWPGGSLILVAPQQYIPDLGNTRQATLYDATDWSVASQVPHGYIGGRFTPLQGGNVMVLGETYERRGLAFLSAPNWSTLAATGKAAARKGFAGIGGGLLLGADGAHISLVREQVGSLVQARLPHGQLAQSTAFGGSEATARCYLGLANGLILEIATE